MAHIHDVFNTDSRFTIDPDKRQIIQTSGKNKLVKGDHNSECYAFEMPRTIEGHDMSVCNSVRINYRNQSSDNKGEATGPYFVDDLQIDPEDSNKVIFSWIPSRNATKYAGTLNFSIVFRCTTGETIDYERNVGTFKSIDVLDKIDNDGDEIIEEHIDVLEGWRTALEVDFVASVNGIEPDANGNVEIPSGLPSPYDIPSDDGDLMPYDKVLCVGMGDDLEPAWVLTKQIGMESVRFTSQTLNVNQKAQARKNIGAQVEGDYALKSDIPDPHVFTDTITGLMYKLTVENGKLTMTEVTE